MASRKDTYVETTSGPVFGFVDTHKLSVKSSVDKPPGTQLGIRKWLGIPYAQAGRWEKPVDHDPWTEPKDCSEFGPAFPQGPSPFDDLYEGKSGWLKRHFLGQSEDAFTVNVFSPCIARDLPVLVWLYGGNLNSGSGNFPVYDPTEFVRHQATGESPCIVVTGNYRTGILGWLSTDDLAEVNGHPGNFGLYDSIKIFEWVRDNISGFGGNPRNVTAVGESAGASLIGVLFNSRRELFHKAILESGSHDLMAHRPKPFYPPYSKLMQLLGLNNVEGASARVAALKKLSWQTIQEHSARLFFSGLWGYITDPNEATVSKSNLERIERGEYDPWIESAIITINKDEGTFFSERGKFWEESTVIQSLKSRSIYSPETFKEFRHLYPVDEVAPDLSNLKDLACTHYLADQALLTPLHHFAYSLTNQRNAKSRGLLKVYVAQFNVIPKTLMEGREYLGALHTGEIPFVWKMSSLWSFDGNSLDEKTANAVGKRWADFAANGDPGWPEYTPRNGEAVYIGQGGEISAFNVNEIRKKYREFWTRMAKRRVAGAGKF